MSKIIYSNYDLGNEESYNNAKEYLIEECGIEDPSDEDVWDELYAENEIELDEVITTLKHYFNGKTVIVYGSIGLWNGTHYGLKMGDFEEVFYSCVRDYDSIEFSDDEGKLYLHGSHHDGDSSFEMKIVLADGEQFYDDWYYGDDQRTEAKVLAEIFDNDKYSRIPEFWRFMFG